MHWFLWFLFGLLLAGGLINLFQSGDRVKTEADARVGGAFNVAIAIGILVYEGVI